MSGTVLRHLFAANRKNGIVMPLRPLQCCLQAVVEFLFQPAAQDAPYFFCNSAKTQTVVIRDPNSPDLGTAFKPKNGKAYYDNLK